MKSTRYILIITVGLILCIFVIGRHGLGKIPVESVDTPTNNKPDETPRKSTIHHPIAEDSDQVAPPPAAEALLYCTFVDSSPHLGRVSWIVEIPSDSPATTQAVMAEGTMQDGYVELPYFPNALNGGVLTVPGYLPTQVVWREGEDGIECPPLLLQPAAAIAGTVSPPEGTIYVSGCNTLTQAEDDGFFLLEGDVEEVCEVSAERVDGPYRSYSKSVRISPTLERDTIVELTLPEERMAGLGVEIRFHEAGREIHRVRNESTAALAGLRTGDLILEINGVSTAEMDVDEFRSISVGPEGSIVVLDVFRDSEHLREQIELELVFIEDSYHLVDRCDESGCGAYREERPDAWLE